MFGIRRTLQFGSIVFGLSALMLLATPEFFLALLDLPTKDRSLVWAMRMIGVTLVALAGNMWLNAKQRDDRHVRQVGVVMAFSATSLGILTLFLPGHLNLFSWTYSAIGFGFGFNYVVCLLKSNY